jgi:uncharacterized cupredoxin-like copper-binding protein
MSSHRFKIFAAAAVGAVLLAACGADRSAGTTVAGADDGATVVEVTMTDMAFTPTVVNVKAGEKVRFRFRNDGDAIHEAVIGDLAFQQDHAAEMAAMGPSADTMASTAIEHAPLIVQPGETGELTYTATTVGDLVIGCHQPGHWEAGMKATLAVE